MERAATTCDKVQVDGLLLKELLDEVQVFEVYG